MAGWSAGDILPRAMMEPLSMWVSGVPKGQPRPKACKRGAHAGVYDPGTANEWKNLIYNQSKKFVPSEPLEGPLRVDLTFYFPRPLAHYRTGKRSFELRPGSPVYHTSKPDRDNSDKCVLDQLTVLRFWRDDSQVCDGRIRKLYDNGRGPGCLIKISEAPELNTPAPEVSDAR